MMFCGSDLFIHSHLWHYLLPEVCLTYRTFRGIPIFPSLDNCQIYHKTLNHTLFSEISDKVGIERGTPRTVSLCDWSLWSNSCYTSFLFVISQIPSYEWKLQ